MRTRKKFSQRMKKFAHSLFSISFLRCLPLPFIVCCISMAYPEIQISLQELRA